MFNPFKRKRVKVNTTESNSPKKPKKAKKQSEIDEAYIAYVNGESINDIADRLGMPSHRLLEAIRVIEAKNGR